jgi:hypothetical protein
MRHREPGRRRFRAPQEHQRPRALHEQPAPEGTLFDAGTEPDGVLAVGQGGALEPHDTAPAAVPVEECEGAPLHAAAPPQDNRGSVADPGTGVGQTNFHLVAYEKGAAVYKVDIGGGRLRRAHRCSSG